MEHFVLPLPQSVYFVLCCVQPFFKYYSSKADADKKKHDDDSSSENYLHLYWTVFKKVCSISLLLYLVAVAVAVICCVQLWLHC